MPSDLIMIYTAFEIEHSVLKENYIKTIKHSKSDKSLNENNKNKHHQIPLVVVIKFT